MWYSHPSLFRGHGGTGPFRRSCRASDRATATAGGAEGCTQGIQGCTHGYTPQGPCIPSLSAEFGCFWLFFFFALFGSFPVLFRPLPRKEQKKSRRRAKTSWTEMSSSVIVHPSSSVRHRHRHRRPSASSYSRSVILCFVFCSQ